VIAAEDADLLLGRAPSRVLRGPPAITPIVSSTTARH
jgi:hypothetical protein